MSTFALPSNGENFTSDIAKNLAQELQKFLSPDCDVQMVGVNILSTFGDTRALQAVPPEDQELLVQMLKDIDKSILDDRRRAFAIAKNFLGTSLKNIPGQAEHQKKQQENENWRTKKLDTILKSESEKGIFGPLPIDENDDIEKFSEGFPDTLNPITAQKLFEELAMGPGISILDDEKMYHNYTLRAKYVFEKLQEYLKTGSVQWKMAPRAGYEDVDDPRIMHCAELYQFLTGKADMEDDEPLYLGHLKGKNSRLFGITK